MTSECLHLMQQHQHFFLEADDNEDSELTPDEFFAALPPYIKQRHSAADISSWFSMIDVNHNGKISMAEYLQWSLAASTRAAGAPLLLLFQKADRDNDGALSFAEFTALARKLGVQDRAREIFSELPHNDDGTVSFEKVMKVATSVKVKEKPALCSFLMAMEWMKLDNTPVDFTGWSFGCDEFGVESPSQARKELRQLLEAKGVRLAEVFETIDSSDDNMINFDEFLQGMQIMGFQGSIRILHQIWASIDEDNSGEVIFEELNAWLKGRSIGKRGRLNAAKRLTLTDRVNAIQTPWDVDKLRTELCTLLEGANVGVVDLLDTWTTNASISKKVWLRHFKRLCGVGHSIVWYDYVRDAVTDAFELMDRDKGGSVSVQELAGFLNDKKPAPRLDDEDVTTPSWRKRAAARLSSFSGGGNKQPSSALTWRGEGPAPWRPTGIAYKEATKATEVLHAANASHTTHYREDGIGRVQSQLSSPGSINSARCAPLLHLPCPAPTRHVASSARTPRRPRSAYGSITPRTPVRTPQYRTPPSRFEPLISTISKATGEQFEV